MAAWFGSQCQSFTEAANLTFIDVNLTLAAHVISMKITTQGLGCSVFKRTSVYVIIIIL